MNQSCGKCVPCRDGLVEVERMLTDILNGCAAPDTLERLEEMCRMIADCADCAVGVSAAHLILDSLREYDGFVIGSPVYFAGPNGHLCAFLDRLFWAGGKYMSGKVGAAVVCCRRGGASSALDRLNKYLNYGNMHIVGSNYWTMAYGLKSGEVKEDSEGMQTMRTLGENMAWMIKNLKAGKEAGVDNPNYERKQFTNFIR